MSDKQTSKAQIAHMINLYITGLTTQKRYFGIMEQSELAEQLSKLLDKVRNESIEEQRKILPDVLRVFSKVEQELRKLTSKGEAK